VINAKDFGDLDNQLDDIREKTCSEYFVRSAYPLLHFNRKAFRAPGIVNYERTVHQPGIHGLKYIAIHERPRGKSSGMGETVRRKVLANTLSVSHEL